MSYFILFFFFFFFNDTATTEIYTLSLHDALPIKPAPVERDRVIAERCEIDRAGDDVGLEREHAARGLLEPEVDPGEIAGRHRSPGKRGAWARLHDISFRVEEVHLRKPRKAIALERQSSLPHRLAAAAAVLRALPHN